MINKSNYPDENTLDKWEEELLEEDERAFDYDLNLKMQETEDMLRVIAASVSDPMKFLAYIQKQMKKYAGNKW